MEDLFGAASSDNESLTWAWQPNQTPCRYWLTEIGGRRVLFPAEATAAGVIPHDGVFQNGVCHRSGDGLPENTLVMASCDPAAGLLVNEFARASGYRLLVLHRSSTEALDLLRRNLVHVAGVHLAAANHEEGNVKAAKAVLGDGYALLRIATWQEGLAVGPGLATPSIEGLLRSRVRWVGREPGSGARQCQDELLTHRRQPRRLAKDHRGVAAAIQGGWADVGVCVRLACDEAGLRFIRIRDEAYDLCFAAAQQDDPRFRALLRAVQSAPYRTCLSELPGYDGRSCGEVLRVE